MQLEAFNGNIISTLYGNFLESKYLTLMFVFYCDNDVRRDYLYACFNSLGKDVFEVLNDIEVLVIDGSPPNHARMNYEILNKLSNGRIRYINENIIERYKPSLFEDECNNIEIKLGSTKIE